MYTTATYLCFSSWKTSGQRKIVNMPILIEIMPATYLLKNCATTG